MALFTFRKKKVDSTTLAELRKTKSTGNIIENTEVLSTVRHTATKAEPVLAANESTDRLKHELKHHEEKPETGNNSSADSSSTEQDSKGHSSSSSSSSSSCNETEDDTSVSSLPSSMTTSTTIKVSKNEHRPQHMTLPRDRTIVKSNSSPSTPREVMRTKDSYFSSDDLVLLLSQETEARIEAQQKKAAEEVKPIRQTRLKFELPETPPRSRSPAYSAYSRPRQRWSMPDEKALQNQQQSSQKKKTPRKSRWTKIMGVDSSEDEEFEESPRALAVGDKVRVLHRPLPILGYIRYMGPVHFAEGDDWLGLELDNRVGKNDGQVDGKRYFETDLHRGIFLQKSEVSVV